LKLVKSKRVLFSKSKNNLEKIVFSKLKKNKDIDKIDKSNLLLEFLIWFESKIALCCYYNIVTKSLFKLASIEFNNLLIIFVALDKIVNKQVLLF